MIQSSRRWLLALGLGLSFLAAGCAGDSEERNADAKASMASSGTATDRDHNEATTPQPNPPMHDSDPSHPTDSAQGNATELATFGAGCYWCTEAVLEQLDGVRSVTSGFMGGSVPDPSYEDVCAGITGHAEVVQVAFDPSVISYAALVEWFWQLHDPTTLNRQGPDAGTQYRSAIFYHSPEQKAAAEASMAKAGARFAAPIVTEITAASDFWPAKQSHQNFYANNRSNRYCRAIIAPKLEKLGLEK